jgi:hypothetical protein
MISSQEGTEDRRPLGPFLLPARWRFDCSSADSAWAGGIAAGSAAGVGAGGGVDAAAGSGSRSAGDVGSGGAGVVDAEAGRDSAVTGTVADVLTGPAGRTSAGSAAGAGADSGCATA